VNNQNKYKTGKKEHSLTHRYSVALAIVATQFYLNKSLLELMLSLPATI